MPNISEEKWIEMLEKKEDGTFVAKYPKVKSKSGVTFDDHESNKTTAHGGIVKFEQGSYVGNGASNRFISTSFTPKLLILTSYPPLITSPTVFAVAQQRYVFGVSFTRDANEFRVFEMKQQYELNVVANGFEVSDDTERPLRSYNFAGHLYNYTIIG